MKKFISLAAGCCILLACNNQPAVQTVKTDSAAAVVAETKPEAPVEIADPKYMEMGAASLVAMSKGDISGFVANYADNAVYLWSSGDSLVGLPAITKYWTDRRTKVIDSISFANDIWLPIKVNKPQKGPDMKGIWILGWYQFNTKYKNGKSAGGWIHFDMHLNDAGKVDRAIQYIDKAPINKALGIK